MLCSDEDLFWTALSHGWNCDFQCRFHILSEYLLKTAYLCAVPFEELPPLRPSCRRMPSSRYSCHFSRTTHFPEFSLEKNSIFAAFGSISSEGSTVSRLRAVWSSKTLLTQPFLVFLELVSSCFRQRTLAGIHRHCGGTKKRFIDQFFPNFFFGVQRRCAASAYNH